MQQRPVHPLNLALSGAFSGGLCGAAEAAFLVWGFSLKPAWDMPVLRVAVLGYALVGAILGLVLYIPLRGLGRATGGGLFPWKLRDVPEIGSAWTVTMLLVMLLLILTVEIPQNLLGTHIKSVLGLAVVAGSALGLFLLGRFLTPRSPKMLGQLGFLLPATLILLLGGWLGPGWIENGVYGVDEEPGRIGTFYTRFLGPDPLEDRETSGAPSAERPDVIVITLDTTRVDHLSAYGYERDTSPFLREFAAESVVFDRAYASSSWTVPTHASMFTGLFPYSHGARYKTAEEYAKEGGDVSSGRFGTWIRPLDPVHITMAEILKAHGYQTGGFVAGRYMGSEFGMAQGFDWYDDRMPLSVGPKLALYHWVDQYFLKLEPDLLRFNRAYRRADEVNGQVFDWLDSHQEQRIFLFVNYFDAHAPYWPLKEYRDLFEGSDYDASEEDTNKRYMEILRGEGGEPTEEEWAWVKSQYDAEIRFQDFHMNELFERLKAEGRWDNSLIFILADHGENLGEHNLVGHGFSLYAQVTRIPFLVKFPKQDGLAGETRSYPVHQVDILPTVLERLKLDFADYSEARLQGLSVLDNSKPHDIVGELYRDKARVETFGERYSREIQSWTRADKRVIQTRPLDSDSRPTGPVQDEYYDPSKDPFDLNLLDAESPQAESLQQFQAWLENAAIFVPSEFIERFDMGGSREALNEVGYAGEEED